MSMVYFGDNNVILVLTLINWGGWCGGVDKLDGH